MCLCQLFVIVIHYLFICARLFVIHCSTIYSPVVYFISHRFFVLLFKREKSNSDLELCSGISIPLTVHHHQYKLINIIQQTPQTLS
jgi:hypothetical protein